MLIEISEAGDINEAVFRSLRERLVPYDARISVYDKDDLVALHLQALANREVFIASQDASDVLKGNESMSDIVKMAIAKEWDSILFYSAIRDLMESDADRTALDDVIREEEAHVKDLQESL